MKKFLFPIATTLLAVLIAGCSPANSPASDKAPVVPPPAPPAPVLDASFSADAGSFYWGQGTAGADNGTIKPRTEVLACTSTVPRPTNGAPSGWRSRKT